MESKSEELRESQQRVDELVQQLSVPLTDTIGQLMLDMKTQHENLLHQQLSLLKRTYASASLENDLNRRVYFVSAEMGSGEGENNFVSTEFVSLGADKFTTEHQNLVQNENEVLETVDEHVTESTMMAIKSEGLESSIVDSSTFSEHFDGLVELDISRKRKSVEDEEEEDEKPKKKQLT